MSRRHEDHQSTPRRFRSEPLTSGEILQAVTVASFSASGGLHLTLPEDDDHLAASAFPACKTCSVSSEEVLGPTESRSQPISWTRIAAGSMVPAAVQWLAACSK